MGLRSSVSLTPRIDMVALEDHSSAKALTCA